MSNPRKVGATAKLLEQINAAYPNRSKTSDGWIGDTAHSTRKSDHNPDADGSVDAIDITHDPVNGPDNRKLADALLASRDSRIKYIISNRQIAAGRNGPSPWVWRPYTGSNPHQMHMHLSINEGSDGESKRAWKIDLPKTVSSDNDVVLKPGASGKYVRELQEKLSALGFVVPVNGIYDERTTYVVRRYQEINGLNVDGWAGSETMASIGKSQKAKEAAKDVSKGTTGGVIGVGTTAAVGVGVNALGGIAWQNIAVVGVVGIVVIGLLMWQGKNIAKAYKGFREELDND